MSSRRTRRDFLFQSSAGLGSVALSALLSNEQARAGVLSPKPPHHPPRAKACIFLLMGGGPSHIDTFDPKPKLDQLHMTEFVREQEQVRLGHGIRQALLRPEPVQVSQGRTIGRRNV